MKHTATELDRTIDAMTTEIANLQAAGREDAAAEVAYWKRRVERAVARDTDNR